MYTIVYVDRAHAYAIVDMIQDCIALLHGTYTQYPIQGFSRKLDRGEGGGQIGTPKIEGVSDI